MLKLKTFLILMLTALSAYSTQIPDSCRIVLIEKDTFTICPISVIKTANVAFTIMEGQDKLISQLEAKTSKMQFESDVLKMQNSGLKASVATQAKVTDELRKNNGQLLIQSNEQKNIIKAQRAGIYVLSIVAIVEFFLIIIK
jgi:hypothetical protein